MKRLVVPLAFMAASSLSLFLGFTLLRSALAGFVLYYLACCLALPALDILVLRGTPPRLVPALLGLKAPRRADVALGLGSGAAMTAAMLIALAFLKESVFGDGRIQSVLGLWGASGRNLALVYVVMLAFNGAVEELFWRGFLHERLGAIPNRLFALGLPTLFFGAQHLFVVSSLVADPALVALLLLGILGAGAVWALLRERTRSVLPCILSHVLVTAGYMGALSWFGPA
jgi:membrane protease YdiL (CAAX protease family)